MSSSFKTPTANKNVDKSSPLSYMPDYNAVFSYIILMNFCSFESYIFGNTKKQLTIKCLLTGKHEWISERNYHARGSLWYVSDLIDTRTLIAQLVGVSAGYSASI